MGKRYKKGNVGRRKVKKGKSYIERERKINVKINEFRRIVFESNYHSIVSYKRCNRLRLELKQLFDVQSGYIHKQSRKRRYIYYRQLSKFKGVYVTWKKNTVDIYLLLKFDFPLHLISCLSWFYSEAMQGETYDFNWLLIRQMNKKIGIIKKFNGG